MTNLQEFMLKYPKIPTHTLNGLLSYWKQHTPTGGFLAAVLSNKLIESFQRADDFNRPAMEAICSFVYNEMPSGCYGSVKIVEEWINA